MNSAYTKAEWHEMLAHATEQTLHSTGAVEEILVAAEDKAAIGECAAAAAHVRTDDGHDIGRIMAYRDGANLCLTREPTATTDEVLAEAMDNVFGE